MGAKIIISGAMNRHCKGNAGRGEGRCRGLGFRGWKSTSYYYVIGGKFESADFNFWMRSFNPSRNTVASSKA